MNPRLIGLEPILKNSSWQVTGEARSGWDGGNGISFQLAGMFLYESLEVDNEFELEVWRRIKELECVEDVFHFVADRIGSVVVAALTRTQRGLVSELVLTTADGVPTNSVVNLDNIHTIPRSTFRRKVATLSPAGVADACRTLQAATGC